MLTAAVPPIRRCFGPQVEATLGVVHDPEGGDVPELYVRLDSGEDWQAATEKLDRFDAEWWLEARAATDSLVTFDIAVH